MSKLFFFESSFFLMSRNSLQKETNQVRRAIYGARYFKRSRSSSRDSRARVLMCMITVPVIRGERLIGAVWQREQLAAKARSPASFWVDDDPGVVVGRADSPAGRSWPAIIPTGAASANGSETSNAKLTRRFIDPP